MYQEYHQTLVSKLRGNNKKNIFTGEIIINQQPEILSVTMY